MNFFSSFFSFVVFGAMTETINVLNSALKFVHASHHYSFWSSCILHRFNHKQNTIITLLFAPNIGVVFMYMVYGVCHHFFDCMLKKQTRTKLFLLFHSFCDVPHKKVLSIVLFTYALYNLSCG